MGAFHFASLKSRIQIPVALFFDGVAGEEATERGGVMAVVVVNEVEFGVVKLRRPLEVLDDAVFGSGNRAERSVTVRRSDQKTLAVSKQPNGRRRC